MVSADAQRRSELAKFFRARRQQLVRADLGLPAVGRRGTGLRREEVAFLSGVSVTWYTWLEQGREIVPSRQVLDAIARTLRLSGPEHAYVWALAGYSTSQFAADPVPQTLPAHVQRLLDTFAGQPAYVLAPDWRILGWSPAFTAVYPRVTTMPDEDRNLLWLVFTDPFIRELLGDWKLHSTHNLAQFRAEAGPHLGEPPFVRLVARLVAASAHFRDAWESHDIEGFTSRQRLYHHPVVGDLHLEQHRMALSDHPQLHLVIYTPVSHTDTTTRLRQLAMATSSAGPTAGS
jgi:transcriptional regulator with XRE-family HTH domain